MACQKETKRGIAITHPHSHLIKKNAKFRDGMGLRKGNKISFAFFGRWSMTEIFVKSFFVCKPTRFQDCLMCKKYTVLT